jgi:hypothetical protein
VDQPDQGNQDRRIGDRDNPRDLLEPFTEAQHQWRPFGNRQMDANPDMRYLDGTQGKTSSKLKGSIFRRIDLNSAALRRPRMAILELIVTTSSISNQLSSPVLRSSVSP